MLDTRQTVLLQFKDLRLETLFGVYHTRVLRSVDATWEIFSILCLVLAVTNGIIRGHKYVPVLEWALFFTYPSIGLILQTAFPKAWYRIRELVCVAHRFDVMASTSQPGSFAQERGLLFAYGMAGMMMNSIGHKVRFHVHAPLTAMTYCLALGQMWHNSIITERIQRPTLSYLALHQILTVWAPCVLVYLWDKRIRQVFLTKFLVQDR